MSIRERRTKDEASRTKASAPPPTPKLRLVTSIAGDLVPIGEVEGHLRKLGMTEDEIDKDMKARGLRPKDPDPEVKFKSDLQTAYEQLGGINYLKMIAINNPQLFFRHLVRAGVLDGNGKDPA